MKALIRILSWFIPISQKRKRFRKIAATWYYNRKLFRIARIGKDFCSPITSCSVNKNTVIGDYVTYNGVQIAGDGIVKIGNYCHFGEDILIITRNHNYESSLIPFDGTFVYKDIEISDFCWIGSRTVILPGTKIGEGVIIQAGAVVHGVIPSYSIVGGNPAKVFKYRDIEHFKKLKSKGCFFIPF